MSIEFLAVDTKAVPVQVSKRDRELFNRDDKYYHMVELVSANMFGWELKCPVNFAVEWNGGSLSTDTVVHTNSVEDASYFYTGMGNGIFSVSTGYVVKTTESYGVLLTSIPNYYKINVHWLTSLIESDWEHIPYHVHMKMAKPGRVEFRKGEPLGFVTIVPRKQMENFECSVDTIMKDKDLFKKYLDWLNGEPAVRSDKNVKLRRIRRKKDA